MSEIDIEEAIVSIDAMGTQREIVDLILDKKGHYLLSVKGNQKSLYEDIECALQWNVNLAGTQDGYFTAEQRDALFERIRDSGAKIVTVAMGSPKQEIFMRDCRKIHPDALYMGVGGTYDVFTGHVKRAPKVWQNMGLEWLYRLLSQPTRFRRQLKLLKFLGYYYGNKL